MCKKILTIAIAFVFVLSMSGLVFAANTSKRISFGFGNSINHIQTGDGNIAQTYQNGFLNTATIEQTTGNKAYQKQSGMRNAAEIHQQGSVGSEACQIQSGMYNTAKITQEWSYGKACQNQTGFGNTAEIYDRAGGEHNEILQLQNGSYNTAIADITGNNNKTTQVQTGFGNWSKIVISSKNGATVNHYQRGFGLTQTINVATDGQVINLYQTGW